MPANLREAGKQVSGLGPERNREAQQRLDPDLPTILLNQVDLRTV
jgi:hypothetical protein